MITKKNMPLATACKRCRARKSRCEGQPPVCRFCYERALTCEWDLLAGLNNEELRLRVQEATRHLEDARILIKAMQSGSAYVSSLLLARLRHGVSVFDLADSIRDGTVGECTIPQFIKGEPTEDGEF